MNLMTIKKIISGDRSRPHKLSKGGGWISSFKVARVPTLSPLMIFLLSDIGFIPSRFFFFDTNSVIMKVLICLQDLFLFSLSSLLKITMRIRERERETKKILETTKTSIMTSSILLKRS